MRSAPIRIAAAVIVNDGGQMLMVRKRGTRVFMQPGGKIDAGETPFAALLRELHEELGLDGRSFSFQHNGQFSAAAAHEPGQQVLADLFAARANPAIRPQAEIAEAIWLSPLNDARPLAPLSQHHALPIARAMQRSL